MTIDMNFLDDVAIERIRQGIARFSWYHKIDLGNGLVTPGLDLDSIWDGIRQTRRHLDYKNKHVLDIASFDGMWAFEAEKLGAGVVVATDSNSRAYPNFLFCRQALDSGVIPYYNVSPYELSERLVVHFEDTHEGEQPYHNLFEIVQHFGVLYHLRDPLWSLSQARSVIRKGGYLLLETAVVLDDDESYMTFNGVPPEAGRIYEDVTTWWAPSVLCLKEMLRASFFEVDEQTLNVIPQADKMGRISLIAVAIGPDDVTKPYFDELARTYRNPGLKIENLNQ